MTGLKLFAPGIFSWTTRLAKHVSARLSLVRQAFGHHGEEARGVIARSIERRAARLLGREPKRPPVLSGSWARYPEWLELYDSLQMEDHEAISACMMSGRPRIGIVVYFNDAHRSVAGRVAAAIHEQLLAPIFVKVVLSDRATPSSEATARSAFGDPRVGYDADPELAETVDAILLMDASHVLRKHALAAFGCMMANRPTSIIYSDEDRLTQANELGLPLFKPAFSPLFAETGYMGSCAIINREFMAPSAVVELLHGSTGGVRDVLRTITRGMTPGAVGHIPMPLTTDTLPRRVGLAIPLPSVSPASPSRRLKASIIIPSRNRVEFLKPCIQSIIDVTHLDDSEYEIIVVNNDSDDPNTLHYLHKLSLEKTLTVIDDRQKFNYSRLNNNAASRARGDVLVFLNNDTLVIQPDWLARLIAEASIVDVGAVGVKLLYEDRTVQHAGVILGVGGVAGHGHLLLGEEEPGYHGFATSDREVSAVTGACMAMRKQVFDELQGFDLNFPVAYNDVMLCIAALQSGYRNVVLNSVKLIHLESKSRGFNDTPDKVASFMREATLARGATNLAFQQDRYYNPNLSLDEPYGLAQPPRRQKPWFIKPRGPLRVLLLSAEVQSNTGVAILVKQQIRYLSAQGYVVSLGAPANYLHGDDIECHYVRLNEPQAAAIFACRNNIDCIIAHTSPFYSVSRWLGPVPPVIAVDHGSPPPDLFDDAEARQAILAEKRFALAMATQVCAISRSVKIETGVDPSIPIPTGNSHFATWCADMATVRARTRVRRDWSRKVVVLNVCDFDRAAHRVNGVDLYGELAGELRPRLGARDPKVVYALAGKGGRKEASILRQRGLDVQAIETDAEMVAIYAAADVYIDLARWKGFDIGIAQALTMGLPIIASDISAHRADESTSIVSGLEQAIASVLQHARQVVEADFAPVRHPRVVSWEPTLSKLEEQMRRACASAAARTMI